MNINNVKFEASFGTSSQLRKSDMPEIVFAGKSNVGKSSLINKFFNRKNLARVSGVPGKTTTINFFLVDGVRIADLPGYGYAKRSDKEKRRWGELMEAYFASERNIRLVVQLLDMRHEPTEDDRTMLQFLTDAGFPFICVLTKCDKLNKTERRKRREAFESNPLLDAAFAIIEASAQNGEGMQELKEIIEESLLADSDGEDAAEDISAEDTPREEAPCEEAVCEDTSCEEASAEIHARPASVQRVKVKKRKK